MKSVPADLPITLSVRMDAAQMVLQGLGQYPYNQVSALMDDIKNQVDLQVMRYLSPPEPAASQEPEPSPAEENAPQS